jgi:DNA-binding NtrC family response regulator
MGRSIVLVAEDRPSVLKLMVTVLEGAHDVLTASHGAEALALIGSTPIDVVLTDVRMPGATGFDVLRAVQIRSPRTRVVVMTAYANVPDAVAAMRLGAYDYVAKPIDADEIALVVARAVEHGAVGEDSAREPPDARAQRVDVSADPTSLGFHRAVEEARARASREYLVNLMRLYGGNVTHAATRAGMTRESLHRVLRTYGVRAEQLHPAPGGRSAGNGAAGAQTER